MSEASAAVRAAKETEGRLTALEHDVPHLAEMTQQKLDGLDAEMRHRFDDMSTVLARIEKQTTTTNGTVASVVAEQAKTSVELGRHASRIVDLQGDIDENDGRIEALEEARHIDDSAREKHEERKQGRWDVLKTQWKVIAAIYALGGGTAGIVAIVAYILEWRPI